MNYINKTYLTLLLLLVLFSVPTLASFEQQLELTIDLPVILLASTSRETEWINVEKHPGITVDCDMDADGVLELQHSNDAVIVEFTEAFNIKADQKFSYGSRKKHKFFRLKATAEAIDINDLACRVYAGEADIRSTVVKDIAPTGNDAILVKTITEDREIALGKREGEEVIHKFGFNGAVSTSLSDIWTVGGVMPWPASDLSLEILSDDADDTTAGSGCRVVSVEGLDENWAEQTATAATNGLSAVALSGLWRRVNDLQCTASGTYGATNEGTISVRDVATPLDILGEIPVDGTLGGLGSSQMTHRTIPAGKKGLLRSYLINVESTKAQNVFMNIRTNADDTSVPINSEYSTPVAYRGAMDTITRPIAPPRLLLEKTDFWFSSYATAATGHVQVNYELVLIDD